MQKKEFLHSSKNENQNGKINNDKECFNSSFYIVGMFVIYNFKDHNQKRAIDACIAGSQKLEKPMTVPEAKIFCEEQIKNNK